VLIQLFTAISPMSFLLRFSNLTGWCSSVFCQASAALLDSTLKCGLQALKRIRWIEQKPFIPCSWLSRLQPD